MTKVLEILKVLLVKVKAYIIALAANLWEDYLKDKLHDDIHNLLIRGVNLAKAYYASDAYETKKEAVFNFIFDNIKLPAWLKPFKWLVKQILTNSIEAKIEELLEKADNIIDKEG